MEDPLTTRDGLPVVSQDTCESTRDLLIRATESSDGLAELVFDMSEQQPDLYQSFVATLGAYESATQAAAVTVGFFTAYESLRRQAASNKLSF